MSAGELIDFGGVTSIFHLNGDSTDATGNHNGTDTTITYVPGKFGSAANFNGSSSKIDLANNFDFSGNFTILAWCRPSSLATDQAILGAWAGTTNFIFRFDAGSGSVMSLINASAFSTNGKQYVSTSTIIANIWNFVAVVYDNAADTATFYAGNPSSHSFSSSLGVKTTWGAGAKASNAVHDIGDRDGNDFFGGQIDEVAVYSKVWNRKEIQDYFAWATGRFTKII